MLKLMRRYGRPAIPSPSGPSAARRKRVVVSVSWSRIPKTPWARKRKSRVAECKNHLTRKNNKL